MEAPLIRLSVGTLRQVVKRDLPIAFVRRQLTSYGVLELLRRIDLTRRRLQAAWAALGGDYGGACLALLLLSLPQLARAATGARNTWSATRSCAASPAWPVSQRRAR